MDTYDGLELARLFKPFRDAMAVALIVCALFFRDELVAVIMWISQEHARHVLDELLKHLNVGDSAS